MLVMCAEFAVPRAQPYDSYLWQTHLATSIPAADVTPMVQRLREQVGRVLGAGHLGPMRQYFADIDNTAYYLYQEPGRIVTTLAMAYPYLTVEQRDSVRAYVRAELADADYAPWSPNASLPETEGSRREYYTMTQMWGWSHWYGMDGQNRPRLATLYGLWLYAWNSGDTAVVRDNWSVIRSYYSANSSRGTLYGPMAGHLAVARMAHMVSDNATMTTAAGNFATALAAGKDLAAVRAAAATTYSYKHDPRNDGLLHHGWPFLNLTPEVGRFLADSVRGAVVAMHDSGVAMFPLWWVARAQYFCRWTGDEGIGLPTEAIGMLFPVERWVKGTSKESLAAYRMDAACHMLGTGDCYTLEALVNTINAYGDQAWVDVRSSGPVLSPFLGEIAVRHAPGVRAAALGRVTARPLGHGQIAVRLRLATASPVTVTAVRPDGRTIVRVERGVVPAGESGLTVDTPCVSGGMLVLRVHAAGTCHSVPVVLR